MGSSLTSASVACVASKERAASFAASIAVSHSTTEAACARTASSCARCASSMASSARSRRRVAAVMASVATRFSRDAIPYRSPPSASLHTSSSYAPFVSASALTAASATARASSASARAVASGASVCFRSAMAS